MVERAIVTGILKSKTDAANRNVMTAIFCHLKKLGNFVRQDLLKKKKLALTSP